MSHFAAGGRASPSVYSDYMVQRPQSQAGNYNGINSGGGTRPESRLSGLGGERTTSPDAPFDNLLDYSKVNSARHQATRSDTFGTPSRLEMRKHAAKADTRAMHDVFEYGFAKSVQNLGKGILDDVRAELRQTLVTLRKEVAETLAGLADTRDSAAGDILAQVLEKVQELHHEQFEVRQQLRQQQEPVVEGLLKIRQGIGDGEVIQQEGQRDLAQKMEERFADTFSRVSEEIKSARQQQKQETSADLLLLREELQKVQSDGASLREVVGRTEARLENMATEQQTMKTGSIQTGEEIRKMHAESEKHYQDQVALLQDPRLTAEVDFSPILKEVERVASAVNGDMGTLEEVLGEIGKVQQALYIDYFKKNRRGSGTGQEIQVAELNAELKDSEDCGTVQEVDGVRVREFFTQTDIVETVDVAMITDRVEFAAPPKPRQMKRLSIVRPETEALKKKKPKNVIDGDAMKQKMREALIAGEYNVFDFYYDTGWAQKIAKSKTFEFITFLVIFLNGCWIAVDTDHNDEAVLVDADAVFQVAENCFCIFFSFELLVRFLAFRKKANSLKDWWFVFDFLLVSLMVLETWVVTLIVVATNSGGGSFLGNLSLLRMFRMVKMLRMARLARILRSVPELVVLIKTIGVASRSVFFFFIFWLILIYIFGVAFRVVTKGSDVGDQYFESVPDAMNTLLLDGLLPAQSTFVNDLATANPILWPCIIAFILLASLTVMNMLIGVLVEVVSVVASTEKEKMSVLGVKGDMKDAMEYMGIDHSVPLSQDQFVNILMNPEMLNVIQGLGIDPFALVDATDSIFADLEKDAEAKGLTSSPGLSFEMFIDILLKMRGKNPATVKDVMDQSRFMKSVIAKLEEAVRSSRKLISSEIRALHLDIANKDEDSDHYTGIGTRPLMPDFDGARRISFGEMSSDPMNVPDDCAGEVDSLSRGRSD